MLHVVLHKVLPDDPSTVAGIIAHEALMSQSGARGGGEQFDEFLAALQVHDELTLADCIAA